MMGQAQIQPQPAQSRVAIVQRCQARRLRARLGQEQAVLQVQCRIHQALGYGMTIGTREAFALWQQPLQQVEDTGEDNHVAGHG